MKSFISVWLIIGVFFGNVINAQNIYIGTDLFIKGNGSLYVSGDFSTTSFANYSNDATVEIKGNISNDKPTMAQGAGLTKLTGILIQTISGTQPFVVNNITIHNTSSGSNNIVINKNLIIGASATFIDGILESDTDSITFLSEATYSGASDNSHINAIVEKVGNQAFTFPVGDDLKLRTAGIEAPSLITDVVTCKYFRSIPGKGIMGEGVDHVSTLEYWIIKRTNGFYNPLVTLSYDSVYSGEITNIADLRVTNLIEGTWADMGGPGIGSTTGMIRAVVVSATGGEFTLGSVSSFNPLPIELLSFKAIYNNNEKKVDLKWETSSEKNSDYFSVERSVNGNDWTKISTLKAAGNSTSNISYQDYDFEPFSGINYYRLKETDFNADVIYSNIEYVTINSDASEFSVSPNPVLTSTTVDYWVTKDEEFQLELTNSLGQVFIKKNIQLKNGENQIIVDMGPFSSGNYILKIHSMDFTEVQTKKIIKLN